MNINKRSWTDEQLVNATKVSNSHAGVLKELGLTPSGGNYKVIKKTISDLKIDISHFTGQGWNKGGKFQPKPAQPLSEILIKNSSYTSSYKLKNRILKEELKDHKCENCGNMEWMGRKIPLELHHINGDHSDNRLENLQLLCPNCHALTDNYRGKNILKKSNIEKNSLELSSKTVKPKKEVVFSQRRITKKSKKPDKDSLLSKIIELKSTIAVGEFFKVSERTIRNWIKQLGIKDEVDEIRRSSRNKKD